MQSLSLERQVDPALLAMRQLRGVDELLDAGALLEVALVLLAAGRDLLEDVLDEAAVERRRPFVALLMAGVPVPVGNLELAVFDGRSIRVADMEAFEAYL